MISLTFLSLIINEWNITIKISDPALSVEDNDSPLVSNGSEFVLLVGDVLKRDDLVLMDDGVVVPEGFGVGKRCCVVIFHTEDFLFDVDYVRERSYCVECSISCLVFLLRYYRILRTQEFPTSWFGLLHWSLKVPKWAHFLACRL